MVAAMTHRACLVLLAVAALAAPSSTLAQGVISRRRPRRVQGLQVLLGDVGDAWRALLLGAPPTLLSLGR